MKEDSLWDIESAKVARMKGNYIAVCRTDSEWDYYFLDKPSSHVCLKGILPELTLC